MVYDSIIKGVFINAEKTPGKTAIVFRDEEISYGFLIKSIRKTAVFLKSQGIEKGDRVVFMAEKNPLFVYVYLACHLTGAIAVPFDNKLPDTRVRDIIEQVEPGIVIMNRKIETGYKIHSLNESVLSNDLLNDYSFPDSDDIADLLFTTGTTGISKGVMLSHLNILAGAVNTNIFIGNDHSDTEIIPLPLHHAFGLRRLRTNLYLGATLILIDGFLFPGLIFRAIEKYHATGICMVPAGFSVIRKLMKQKYVDYFRHLKYMEFGSSPLGTEEKKELVANLPHTRICMHYGLTEVAANIFTEFHLAGEKINALGKASPNVKVRIVNDYGEVCAAGEIGEIVVAGDIKTPGYWNNPELTKEKDLDGWFKTGDLGYIDNEGYVFFSGRNDDIINVGGKKVAPLEIENVICTYPGIKECACVGSHEENALTGDTIKAFIVLNDKKKKPVLEELAGFLRDRLELYKVPRYFVFIDHLPKTSSGKVKKNELRDKGE